MLTVLVPKATEMAHQVCLAVGRKGSLERILQVAEGFVEIHKVGIGRQAGEPLLRKLSGSHAHAGAASLGRHIHRALSVEAETKSNGTIRLGRTASQVIWRELRQTRRKWRKIGDVVVFCWDRVTWILPKPASEWRCWTDGLLFIIVSRVGR